MVIKPYYEHYTQLDALSYNARVKYEPSTGCVKLMHQLRTDTERVQNALMADEKDYNLQSEFVASNQKHDLSVELDLEAHTYIDFNYPTTNAQLECLKYTFKMRDELAGEKYQEPFGATRTNRLHLQEIA